MLILAVTAAATFAFAQVAVEANKRYQTEEGRGAVAQSLDDPHRDDRQKPKELVAALGLKHGQSVADIGSGTGYMLPYLAEAVGRNGKVFAEDIFDDFLAKARARAESKGLTNVTFVKGSERTTNLPANALNVVVILDAYHHFDYPAEMLASIGKALKSGGRLAIIDYYKTPTAMPNGNAVQHIRLSYDDMVKEVESNGFRLVEKREQIPESQYLALFTKR